MVSIIIAVTSVVLAAAGLFSNLSASIHKMNLCTSLDNLVYIRVKILCTTLRERGLYTLPYINHFPHDKIQTRRSSDPRFPFLLLLLFF
jgi:hypothetical protein